jgi:hypothetical protein
VQPHGAPQRKMPVNEGIDARMTCRSIAHDAVVHRGANQGAIGEGLHVGARGLVHTRYLGTWARSVQKAAPPHGAALTQDQLTERLF